MAGPIYYQMFTPKEIDRFGEFQAKREAYDTQLRIASDHDGERERVVRLPLITNPAPNLIHRGQNLTVKVRVGLTLTPNKKDPLYLLISDGSRAAIGFKITGDAPIKGAEGIPDRFFDLTRLSGDDSETATLSASDYPDEFNITLKPEQYWGTIFCTQGNGTKQCVGYGKKPDLTQGVYFELYRDKQVEEYIINYVEVTIYSNDLKSEATRNNTDISSSKNKSSAIVVETQEAEKTQPQNNAEQKVRLRSLIVQQLKDFKSLEEGGILTSDEFVNTKEKLLNELSSLY